MPTATADHAITGPFDRNDLESFQPLRGLLAESRWTRKIYHAIDAVDKAGVRLLSSLRAGSLNARRYLAIIEHLRHRHCDRLLEVGVWRGDTSELLLLNSRNEAIEYHGVDVFDDTSAELIAREVSLPADPEVEVRARLGRVSPRVHLHRGLSRDVLPRLRQSGVRFSVIWLDGGHSYETVKLDFANCLPLLDHEEGTIFFDDYTSDPYLPDVKRFIDRELMADPALDVTIHDEYADHYRGHDYRVVSVRRRSGTSRPAPAVEGLLPAGFYYHLLHGVTTDDLPWEAPYLFSQARACLERGLCVNYARSLLDRARPFLTSTQLAWAARLLVRRELPPADVAAFLLDSLAGEAPAIEALVQADGLLLRTRHDPMLAAVLHPLAAAVDGILETPDRFVKRGPDEVARRIDLGIILRSRLRLEESEEQLAAAVALAPCDERCGREHRETLKALIRRAHRSGDWRQARRFHGLAAGGAAPDAEWRELLDVTERLSPPAARDVVSGPVDRLPAAEGAGGPSRRPDAKFCSSFWTEGVLLMTGELQFCCRNPTPIGNYERDGLKACWHSATAREMRRKVVAGEYPDAHCEACHRIGATYPLGRPLAAPLGRLIGTLERAADSSLPALRALAGLFGRKELDAEADRVLAAFDEALADVRERPALAGRADMRSVTERLTLLAQVARSFLAGDEVPPVVAPAREVNLIAVCNARCVHCIGRHYDQLEKGLPGPNGRMLKTIGPETHRAALEYPDHIFEFWCNGTEFLIYPRWKEIYQSLAERQIALSLSTNGIALTEEAVRTLIDGGALAGLNVSVDGATRETVEAIRVNVRYDDLLTKLRFLIRYSRERRARYALNFTFTIMWRNHREIPAFVEFVHALFEGEAPIPGTILFTFLQPEGNASYYEFLGREHHSRVDAAELGRLLVEAAALVERYGLKANVTYNHSIQDFIAMGFPFPPLPTEARRARLEQTMLAAHPPQKYEGTIPWEVPTQLCLSDFLSAGHCAIDVGANVGGLSIAMSRMVGPEGHVHSFEANPRLLPVLERDLGLNGAAGNVTTVGLAAWSRSGERLPFYCDDRPWAQRSSLVYNVSESVEIVETIRLDDYVRQHELSPSAIKLDVEGAEADVLEGAEAVLREHEPVVVLEYWPRGEPDPLDILETLGYTCFDTNRYERVDRAYYRRNPLRNIVANVVAVPRRTRSVYNSVSLRNVGEPEIAEGGLRSANLALPASGRYRASVDLDGPESEHVTLVVTSGDGHLVALGASIAEAGEWGRAGLVFQTDAPTTVRAEVLLSGTPSTPVRLRRFSVSKIEGIAAVHSTEGLPGAPGPRGRNGSWHPSCHGQTTEEGTGRGSCGCLPAVAGFHGETASGPDSPGNGRRRIRRSVDQERRKLDMTTSRESGPPVAPRPRVFLFDPNLKSVHGHYLGYARRLQAATRAAQIDTIVLANAALAGHGSDPSVVPFLPHTYWEEMRPAANENPHVHLAREADQLAGLLLDLTARYAVGPQDVLFFPYVNLVETWALARLHRALGTRLPRTVLLFRRDLSEHGEDARVGLKAGIILLRQALGDLFAGRGASRVRLFTDSEQLSEDHGEATGYRFQTAPIPVDPAFVATEPREAEAPLRLLYAGDARSEKGFHLLPDAAELLRDDLAAGRVELIVQSNFNVPGGEPGIPDARRRLSALPGVRLLPDALEDSEYVEWMRRADLVLLPYQARRYTARTSGILAEAVAAAAPAVVPEGTWLAEQLQAHGAGRVFFDEDGADFAATVARSVSEIDQLRSRAFSRRTRFVRFHTPSRLARFVCGEEALALARAESL